MKPLVIYSSKTGNTEKVAAAIASELNCEKFKVNKDVKTFLNIENYDFLFVGTGITYGNPNEDLLVFLGSATLHPAAKCAVFITWGGAGKTNQAVLDRLKTILQNRGQNVVEVPFFCFGGWNFLKRGHPKADELIAARGWANKVLSGK